MAEATPSINRFGNYIVQEKLGSGGMAVVYKAQNEETKETVALKILRSSLMEQPGIMERFKQEATIAERLNHAHIVAVNNYGVIKGRYFLDMQYMAGGTLAERFAKPTEIGSQEAVRLLRNVASGLDFAHRQGVIHRDLKLENILLDSNGHAALADFSIARLSDGNKLTATGFVVGTPMTIAPEQARGDVNLDHRADLYSLAVIAYVLAVGRYPFNGNNPLAILHQHLAEAPPPPSVVNPNLPKALDAVLLRGLAKQPAERYPNADMLIEAFARAVSEQSFSRTVVDLKTDSAGNPIQIVPIRKNDTADDWVKRALATENKEEAIGYLKRALELEPLHSKANRVLFQLEGAVPKAAAAKAKVVTPLPSGNLATLKKANTVSKRSNWYYAVLVGSILVGLSLLFFLLSVSGSPIANQIANVIQGRYAITQIDGVPIKQVPGAVLKINPQDRTTILYGQKINDTLENGFSHAYVFDVISGQTMGIGVFFISKGAQHVSKNVAVMDSNGQSAGNRCQMQKNPNQDTSATFSCKIDQTGKWSLRVLGIDGESTGSYVVTVERTG
ncbi:MAG: protein kinase [Anaerolineaceae bacterium]|nr:protein kinase [Anaerolineaceae bacterium]